jgi:hypothetical protein
MSKSIKEKDILFLTPTVGSVWLFYQQFLIKKHFPLSKRILINGNQRWNFTLKDKCVWYDFIKVAITHKKSFKYFVHIDEDCFLFNKKGVIDAIIQMESENSALIGPTDNMWPIRGENPYALNSFFMIGKIDILYEIWKNFNFNIKFKDLNLNKTNIPINKQESEPYYNFFWNYYYNGLKISKLKTGYSDYENSTTLLDRNNNVFAHHMWYTRYWYKKMKFVSLTHRERYLKIKNRIDKKFKSNLINLISSINYSQFIPILLTRLLIRNPKRIYNKTIKLFIK